jgi:hypothetical protein
VARLGRAWRGNPLAGELRIVPAAVGCFGMAWPGEVRSGLAGRGLVWRGLFLEHGGGYCELRRGLAGRGLAWRGWARRGKDFQFQKG